MRDAKTEGDNSSESEESVEIAHTVIPSLVFASKLHKASLYYKGAPNGISFNVVTQELCKVTF